MSQIDIQVEAGSSIKLLTAEKYCDKDIVVTADGSSDRFYDTFWDVFQNNGNKTNYKRAFIDTYWDETTLLPKYDLVPSTAEEMFSGNTALVDVPALLEKTGITLDFSQCTYLRSTFNSCSNLINLPPIDCSVSTQQSYIVLNCSKLESIEFVNVQANSLWDTAFQGCYALTNVKISGSVGKAINFRTSDKLSDASIQNIIDCLADLTGSTAQTLTFHANVKAKLTDTQIATVTSKNWTLA